VRGNGDNIVWGNDDNIVWGQSAIVPRRHDPEKTAMNAAVSSVVSTRTVTSDWRQALPVLTGSLVTLRELELRDAPSLLALMTTAEVARFISSPPTTVEGFERFIAWAQRERQQGNYACFAVVPHGMHTAVGLFQIRQLEPGFATAEWGFALGSDYWGTGMFLDGAELTVDFAFDVLGVSRLEARAAVANGRGNGALSKIGAVQEAVLRRAFLSHGHYIDQVLWSIIESDRRQARMAWGNGVQVH
jgi:ribosomal-protein-alanine N-acetyltransferase